MSSANKIESNSGMQNQPEGSIFSVRRYGCVLAKRSRKSSFTHIWYYSCSPLGLLAGLCNIITWDERKRKSVQNLGEFVQIWWRQPNNSPGQDEGCPATFLLNRERHNRVVDSKKQNPLGAFPYINLPPCEKAKRHRGEIYACFRSLETECGPLKFPYIKFAAMA